MPIDAENNYFHYSLYFADKKSPNREIEVMNIDRWVDLTPQTREDYIAHYQDNMGSHHVHGANLRSSNEAYFAIGGFAHIPCHEYVNLVEKFKA